MLAASYAAANGLEVVVRVADFGRFPLDADERRDAFLVNEADAAVIVWDGRDPAVRRVLALVERKGIPVHVIGAPQKKPKVRRERDPEPPTPWVAGLTCLRVILPDPALVPHYSAVFCGTSANPSISTQQMLLLATSSVIIKTLENVVIWSVFGG